MRMWWLIILIMDSHLCVSTRQVRVEEKCVTGAPPQK
eukprot:gene48661-54738_t